MGLRERLRGARGEGSPKTERAESEPKRAKKTLPSPEKGSLSSKPAREPGQDWLSKAVRALVVAAAELLKLAREMLVIPAQLWMYVAEVVGAAVLRAWRGVVSPILRAAWRVIRAAFAFAQRHVTPARAVAVVAIAAAVGLAASQWLDYRSVTVGNDAYSGGVEAVAPAPDVARDRAGDAHAFVMVPLAVIAFVCVVVAFTGRRRAARLLIGIGIAAIAIAIILDAPKGLDEGTAALAYEGAEAQLLEGFWSQIAAAAVLVACGLILPAYLRPAKAEAEGNAPRRSLAGRAKGLVRMPSRKPQTAAPKASPPKGSSA